MFNQKTVKIFKVLSAITNTLVVRYPLTLGKSEDGSMCYLLDISEFDDEFKEDLYFNNNFDSFLSIFNLFDEYHTQFNNGVLTISSLDNRTKSDFILSDKDLMKSYDLEPNLFTRISSIPTICTFNLPVGSIKNIRSACGVFSDLSDVIFTVTDKVQVQLGNYSKFNARSNSYNQTLDADVKKECCIRISSTALKTLPVCDYQVEVKYSSNKDAYRILMKAQGFKDLQILLSVLV